MPAMPLLRPLRRCAVVCLSLVAACAAPTPTGPRTSAPPEYARTSQELLPYERQNIAYRWLDVM